MFTERSLDHHILARTLYGEARGESAAGQIAVAQVVFNRVTDRLLRWRRTVAGVCLQEHQFTCWSPGDPNRDRMLAADELDLADLYALALGAASHPPLVAGANHYLTTRLAKAAPPSWYDPGKVVAKIGRHVFLAL